MLVIEKGLVHGLKLIRRDSRKNTKQAVKNIGFFVGVGHITDMQRVMEYGVMSMPALVVNEKAASLVEIENKNDE